MRIFTAFATRHMLLIVKDKGIVCSVVGLRLELPRQKKDTKHTSGGFTSLDSDDFFIKKFRVCTLSVTVTTVARRVILKLNVRSEPKI